MNVQKINNLIVNWLNKKLNNHENGVVLETTNIVAFEAVQDFIESVDCTSKTPVIYFEAFQGESSTSFFATLYDELASKQQNLTNNQQQSLIGVIKSASLKMVVIDKSHLQPIDTLNNLVDFFSDCNVALILISTEEKVKTSGLIDYLRIAQWEKLTVEEKHLTLPKSN